MPGPPERARSSAGEHSLHTGGVTGSIPVAPTIVSPLSMNVERARARVDGVRKLQAARRLRSVASGLVNGRSLRVEMRILDARGECAIHPFGRLGRLAGAQQRPGERGLRGEILAQREVAARPVDRPGAVDHGLRIEIREVVKIMHAAAPHRVDIAGACLHEM